ncbi:unnamed protein product, partial [Tenebrio molitor]
EFAITVLLYKNKIVEQVMEVIDLWEIDSAGEETKQRITRESRRINMFVAINTILAVTWATTHLFHEATETVFVRYIFDLLFPRQADFLFILFNLTLYVATFVMIAHSYEVIYATQHVKFQIYMCKTFIQEMTIGTNSEEMLIYNAYYQQLTESRLKFLINRHCDFIRWRDNALLVMKNLIVPFTFGAIIITTSLSLTLLQVRNCFSKFSLF